MDCSCFKKDRYMKLTRLYVWLILSFMMDFVLTLDAQGHLQPIGKQRLPDLLSINQLEYSPGGQDFYRKYLRSHKPVLIKVGAKHWPLVTKWKNLPKESNSSSSEYFSLEFGDLSNETIINVKKKQLEIEASIPKDSKLLEELRLPLILQCEEYINKLSTVFLRINKRIIDHIQYSDSDEIIVAFDEPLSLIYFGVNETKSGENIKFANMSAVDIEKFPEVSHIPYEILEVNPGDLIYMPKYSWYHIRSRGLISYVKLSFDYISFSLKADLPYVEAVKEYEQILSSLPSTIKCNNIKSSFRDCLSSTINFTNSLEVSHLRIPRKNKRPDDVMLASGHKMPVLGLGTALLNESTYDAVRCALETGYRLFDLAYGYPFAERSFSKALSESSISRDEVFVVTKLHPKYLGYNETLYSIDESLSRLKTSYIDLYLIHSKDCDNFLLKCIEGEPHGTWKESWRAMEYAAKVGKIRSLGVSNFYKDDIYELLNWAVEPVSVVQNWFDPFNPDRETRSICSEYNIRYMGFSTLGNYWKMLGLDYNPVFQSSTITGIAANYDYVISSVVLRWAIHENVTVIPRSSNPIHIAQNFRTLELHLLPEEIDLMNSFDDWMKDMSEEDLEE